MGKGICYRQNHSEVYTSTYSFLRITVCITLVILKGNDTEQSNITQLMFNHLQFLNPKYLIIYTRKWETLYFSVNSQANIL